MKLTTLEIKGFKSFANDTVVHFNERVTGIVGPNGSGKSNIIDAIRWVLGEQKTSELRLDSMSSVIFNGTKKRKGANIARVAITFDNDRGLLPTEFQTLTISRTLYRTGQSEYKINGVTCRLKDINSLLIETGIGSDTYAIIALGMVDDILSDRDQARRRMMEQAAGIVKFKNRKKETIAKLKLTREDLNRVEDLLSEIEANLKTLEKQAKRAKKYLDLKEQYKTLSIEVAKVKLKDCQIQKEELSQKIRKDSDDFRSLEVAIRKSEANLEAQKSELLNAEKALSSQQKELANFIQSLREKENQKQMLQQRGEMLSKNLKDHNTRLDQYADKTIELSAKLEDYNEKIKAQTQTCNHLKVQLEAAKKDLEDKRNASAGLESSLNEVISRQKGIEKAYYNAEKEIAVKNNLLEKIHSDIKSEKELTQNRHEQLQSAQNTADQQSVILEELSKELNSLESKETEREQRVETLNTELKETNKKCVQIKGSISSKQHEYDLTKSMIDNLEGFPSSIRFLSKQKDWMQSATLLSDILYCKDDYRVCIENYLEPYLNYFIVPDRKAALEGVIKLRDSQKGKANFIVLNAYDTKETPKTIDGLVSAVDVVKCDAVYQPIIDHFLSNVYITDKDISNDQDRLIDLDQSGFTLLSKNGGLLYNRNCISGGSVGLFEGKKIGRKKNLEVLEKEIKSLKNTLVSAEKSQSKLEDELKALHAAGLKDQIRSKQQAKNDAERSAAQAKAQLESLQSSIKHAEMKEEEFKSQIGTIQKDIELLTEQSSNYQKQLKDLNNQFNEKNQVNREWSDHVSLASQAYNELNIKYIQQNNHLENLTKELQFTKEQLQSIEVEKNASDKQIDLLNTEIADNEKRILGLDEDIVRMIGEKKENERELGVNEQAFYQARMDIQKQEQSLRQDHQKMMQQQSLINQMKDKAKEVDFAMSGIKERARIEFGVTISTNDDDNTVSEDFNLDEYEVRIEKIKSRLDNFGEVNPMAVEAYDEIKERYDQIVEQKEDILKAETTLLSTIKEVEETAKERFVTAFEQIRAHFVDVFRSLFTEEDFCDIFLENPEDPLESPIQIVARPKGKRPQTLQQLSGGEKTLTATALLFSFYLLKPAPFCIFDEVDAPLDDANIEKFNKIIKNFSLNSQFIVVTHNKGTMASVDVIYGVYMDEPGVSGLSPVDFRKFKHSGMIETVGASE